MKRFLPERPLSTGAVDLSTLFLGRRRVVQAGLAAVMLSAAPLPADAHAVVVEAKPKAGDTVSTRELAIRLRFNSRIDHKRSRLLLISPDKKERTVPIKDDAALDIVTATTTVNASGAYRLRWQVLAVDGHITRGDINFTVSIPGA